MSQAQIYAAGLSPYSGFKNRIINGDMRIDQRNAGAAVTVVLSGPSTFGVDRWGTYATQGSKLTTQQNAGTVATPAGVSKYLGCTSTSAYSVVATDIFQLGQPIEGLSVADLDWGKATAKTITLSFKVYSSLTGTFSGTLNNAAANRVYGFTYVVSALNTWTSISITIPGDTTGTWAVDNTAGIRLGFSLGTGTTSSMPTAGSWQAGAFYSVAGSVSVVGTSGAIFYIADVQLEQGLVATPIEHRPIGVELALCQRYYYQLTPSAYACIGLTDSFAFFINFPVPMRAIPSITHSLTDSQYTQGSLTGTQWTLLSQGVAYATKTGTVTIAANTNNTQLNLNGYGCTFNRNTSGIAFGASSYVTVSAEL